MDEELFTVEDASGEEESVDIGDIPGTFVVSGLIRRINYAEYDRRGYVHENRKAAMVWCLNRYGKALPVDNVPGWAWAFRVPIPSAPLEQDSTLPYHLGFGTFRAVGGDK